MERTRIAALFGAAVVLLMAPVLAIVASGELAYHPEQAVALIVNDKPYEPPIEAAMEIEEEIEYQEAAEEYPEYVYYEPTYYAPSYGGEAADFMRQGVIYENDTRYTWYSQRVLQGGGLTELNENGRHVEDGFVKDGDGYIAVASSDYEIGTVVDTPFGEGKVYDTGCASGTIDVYTDF